MDDTKLLIVAGPDDAMKAFKEVLAARFPDKDPHSLEMARGLLAVILTEYVGATVKRDCKELVATIRMVLETMHVAVTEPVVPTGEPN